MTITQTNTGRLGFADEKRTAEFFGLTDITVRSLAATGEWPTYEVCGRKLFDIDELVRLVKRRKPAEDK